MNSAILVDELKKELKNKGIKYAELAEKIALSEAAVKRLFSERNFSLQRLDQICEAIGTDVARLVRAVDRRSEKPEAFSPEVEAALAADPKLLYIWYALTLKITPTRIRERLAIDKPTFHQLTRHLESLKMLEVLPNERFRMQFSKSVRWQQTGPLSQKYAGIIRDEFFASDFRKGNEHQDFLTGALTDESLSIVKRKCVDLFRTFDQLSALDSSDVDRTEVYWFYSGIRPWAPLEVIAKG